MINIDIPKGKVFSGDRPLFKEKNLCLELPEFLEGESALKESRNITIIQGKFLGNYPLWHVKNAELIKTHFLEQCRSSVWNSSGLKFADCVIQGPKFLRTSSCIEANNIKIINSDECCWFCADIMINNGHISGNYFGLKSNSIKVYNSSIYGMYACIYNVESTFSNVKIKGKDFLWYSKNIRIVNSTINGDYLGWYSDSITIIDSEIKGKQPFCYSTNVVLINTTLVDTTGAFEYSTVSVFTPKVIKSIKNPIQGTIISNGIDDIKFDDHEINYKQTKIIDIKSFDGDIEEEISIIKSKGKVI